MSTIVINCKNAQLSNQADELAQALDYPILSAGLSLEAKQGMFDYELVVDYQGISLLPTNAKLHGAIRCDFSSAAHAHRRKHGGGNGQAIAKAIGVSGRFMPSVIDLTAGLGVDGFVLASLGCSMTLIERNKVVHSLLRDGLERAREAATTDTALGSFIERISLVGQDSKEFLESLSPEDRPDIVYIDPMFPERKKSAKVKKEMQAFHSIVGSDDDSADLLSLALDHAKYRVVVKRSVSAEALGNLTPSYSLTGRSTRFDVFALNRLPN